MVILNTNRQVKRVSQNLIMLKVLDEEVRTNETIT